jgi:NAD(P) transhydrogenase
VFNYPTMAECYKVAAFDGLNKISLDLQLEQEISQHETSILEQVDELVAEVSSVIQPVADEETVAAGDVN